MNDNTQEQMDVYENLKAGGVWELKGGHKLKVLDIVKNDKGPDLVSYYIDIKSSRIRGCGEENLDVFVKHMKKHGAVKCQ